MSAHLPSQVAKNTSYLTVAFLIQKLLTFFYFIYIARSLNDPSLLGKYNYALSFASIFSIILDFGLGPVLTREIAKTPGNEQDYLKKILGLKIPLIVVAIAAMWATTGIIHLSKPFDLLDFQLLAIASVIIILDSFTFTLFSVFRGRQILKYEAGGIMIYQLIIVAAGSLFLFFHMPLYTLLLAITLGSLFHFLYSLFLVVFSANLRVRPVLEKSFIIPTLKMAWPFALAGIFFKLSGQIDTVMLKVLAGNQYTGWYAVALKLTTALTVLPGALATSYFPAISHYFVHDPKRVPYLFERAMLYLMILSLPISFGVYVIADEFVVQLYGPVYGASAQALKVFMISLVFVFLNYPVGNLLNAANRQLLNTLNMGIALVVNVLLNIFLIPRYTFMGAAIAAAISSVVLLALGLPHVYKKIHFRTGTLIKYLSQTVLASLLMALAIAQLQFSMPIALLIIFGAVLYFIILMALGVITMADLRMIGEHFLRIAKKFV